MKKEIKIENKLNKSNIMKKAWEIFKNHDKLVAFGRCLKRAWKLAKGKLKMIIEKTVKYSDYKRNFFLKQWYEQFSLEKGEYNSDTKEITVRFRISGTFPDRDFIKKLIAAEDKEMCNMVYDYDFDEILGYTK